MGHICEGVRKYKEKAASNAQVKADINLLKQCTAAVMAANINSPTKAIRTQLVNTTIAQRSINHTTQSDLFSGQSGGGGNLFNTRTTRPPASKAEKAMLKTSLALYPIQPETPEGEATYLDQLRDW